MPEFITKIVNDVKEIVGKLDLKQKIIIVAVVVLVFAAFIFLISYSSTEDKVLLYKTSLSQPDFDRVKSKLDGLAVPYSQSDRLIYVDNEEEAVKLRAKLGYEGVVRDLKGFELFDNPVFSTTDFERKVNLRRAITGNIAKHLEAIDDIEKAEVTISFGENVPLFLREIEDSPITASVVITPSPNSDIDENTNKIRGIRSLIAKGIARLKEENVIIMNHRGLVLTDLIEVSDADESIRTAKEQLRIMEKIRLRYSREIRQILRKTYTDDRYEFTVNLSLNWDREHKSVTKIIPTELQEDDPDTPYNERKVIPKVEISVQKTKETFKGPSYIPEGPAGVEPNVGPGMKELIDRHSDYTKETLIENNKTGEEISDKQRAPYEVEKVSIAVVVDEPFDFERDENGDIKLVSGRVVPIYDKVLQGETRTLESTLKEALPYASRNKSVKVSVIKFDRKDEFDEIAKTIQEDDRFRSILLFAVLSILGIIILIFLIQFIMREIDSRRRLKEERLALEQQAMREAAIKAAEEEGLGLDIPPGDRVRLEMQENAISLAREKPEDVAQLIRTWLFEE